jgi:hypothetical protein
VSSWLRFVRGFLPGWIALRASKRPENHADESSNKHQRCTYTTAWTQAAGPLMLCYFGATTNYSSVGPELPFQAA